MTEPEDRKVPAAGRQDDDVLASGRRQDFTYRRFHDLRLEGLDLGQSLFIGALIEGCVFTDVDLSRCDLSGTKIVRCIFEDCRFALADIRSCLFDDTQMTRCDFATAQLSRTHCRAAIFTSCRFEKATLLEDTMVDSAIIDCSFKGASVTSTDFDHCAFVDTGLADCTALFLFFDDCRFERFAINAESIGSTFGLTREDLVQIKLVHLGNDQMKPADVELIDVLVATYQARHWAVGAAILELNFVLTPPFFAVRRLAEELFKRAPLHLPNDLVELDFFTRILERLEREGRLPLLAGRLFDRAIRDLVAASPSRRDDRSDALLARVDRLILSMLDEACDILQPGEGRGAVLVELHLKERPPRPLDALCDDVLTTMLGPGEALEFIAGRPGSWFEVWQMVPGALGTVHLVLLAVNGLLKELNKAVENSRRLGKAVTRGKAPAKKAISKRSTTAATLSTPEEDITKLVMATRRRSFLLSDEALRRVDATLNVIVQKSDRDLADLHAYSSDNVLAVKVRPARRAAKRAPRKRAPAA